MGIFSGKMFYESGKRYVYGIFVNLFFLVSYIISDTILNVRVNKAITIILYFIFIMLGYLLNKAYSKPS
jgi:positive regulator of sigma E activity